MSRLSRFIHFYTDEDEGNGGGGDPGILKTVTGALLHITDALAKPAYKFTATLEPIQDLHGQDAPYPAGGGKNIGYLADDNIYSQQRNTNTYANNGVTVTSTGAYSRCGFAISVVTGETYTVSAKCKRGSANIQRLGLGSTNGWSNEYGVLGDPTETLSLFSKTITATTDTLFLEVYVGGNENAFITVEDFQVEEGSSATSFAPYSNICPITGWTGANVNVSEINAWDEQWENGTFNTTTGVNINNASTNQQIRSKNLIPVKAGKEYFVKAPSGVWVIFLDSNGNVVAPPTGSFVGKSGNSVQVGGNDAYAYNVFIVPYNCSYIKFYCQAAYGSTYSNDISINYPSTDTDYHAYVGTTIPITFPVSAGTVYGCTLTLEDGVWKLRVTDAEVDMGALTWTYYDGIFYTNVAEKAYLNSFADMICSAYPVDSANVSNVSQAKNVLSDKEICGFKRASGSSTASYVYLSDSTYDSASALTTALSGVQLVYKLAEPITYTLTETQALSLLKGENNIWCDASDSLELTYYADGNVSTLEALNTLLGGRYTNLHTEDDVSDKEALQIILGETT